MLSISKRVEAVMPDVIRNRRDFHKYAEAAWTEFRTASIVAGKLQALGYRVTLGRDAVNEKDMMGVPSPGEMKKHQERALAQGADPALVEKMRGGFTGLWADMDFGGDGPAFAFRFDMDANDVIESDSPDHRPMKEGFASVNHGAMHACGHDAHTAMGLAVAEILVSLKDQLKGRVRLIFQCAEEGCRGALSMVTAGCVDGIDQLVGAHIGFKAAHKGAIVCGVTSFLASVKMDVLYKGKSAHAGAAPQEGRNALLAACAATTNMHAIARNGNGPTRINVGKLIGGQGRNVIPPEALVVFETRGETTELNDYMLAEAMRILEAAGAMWGCAFETKVMGNAGSCRSSDAIVARAANIAKTMPAYAEVVDSMDFGAGEDVSHMMERVMENGGQATYVQLGVDKAAGHHNERFDFDEQGLMPGIEFLVRLAFDYLQR